MAQINLAPGSQYLIMVRRRRRALYGITTLIVLAIVVAGIVIQIMVSSTNRTAQTLRQELQSIETQIAQASEEVKRIQLFEDRLKNLTTLFDNHRTWSPYLQELERLLPPETVIGSLQGNYASRAVEITGSTTNIDLAAQTLVSLQNQPSHKTVFTSGTIHNVEQVVQTGAGGEVLGQRYNFSMSLTF